MNRTRIRIRTLFIVLLAGAMLVACKPSDEKLSEAETARNTLIEYRGRAEQKYLDLTEESNRAKLDELSARVDETLTVDFTKMSDKKIDEYLPTVRAIISEYEDIVGVMDKTYDSEEADRVEAAKHQEIECYVVNKMGVNLTSLKLHDVASDSYSDNLLGDDVVLTDGYTLMGIMLQVYADSKDYELVASDENGKEYVFACGNLVGQGEDGMSITLKMDTDTGEAVADFGSYISIPKTENADAAASGDSASGDAANAAFDGGSN